MDRVSISYPAHEPAARVVDALVGDDAGHGGAAVHVHRLVEGGVDGAGHVPHVVFPYLARRVGESVGELRRGGVEQQPRALVGVARHAHRPSGLAVLSAVRGGVHHAVDDPLVVVGDGERLALRTEIQVAGGFGFRYLGVQGRPLGARLAALEAEPELLAGTASVPGPAVDGHASGVHALVAETRGAVPHHLEVVVAGQAGDAVGSGDPHLVLGPGVPGLQIRQAQRPVEERRALDVAVDGPGSELVLLEAKACARPVGGGAAHRLADPRRQTGKVLRHPPGSGGRALVEPGELSEGVPLVVGEVRDAVVLAGLQQHHLDALPAQLVGERAAACPGADDHHHAVVVVVEFRHLSIPPLRPPAGWPARPDRAASSGRRSRG